MGCCPDWTREGAGRGGGGTKGGGRRREGDFLMVVEGVGKSAAIVSCSMGGILAKGVLADLGLTKQRWL